MITFIFTPNPGKTGNPVIDFIYSHAYMNKSTLSMGNYDSDDDEQDYDPDEDLQMMFDEEDYDEMHEN